MLRIGIDTGGTFTDFIWVNNAGEVVIHKEPSTPEDPSQSILRGLARLAVPSTVHIVHGSTVATNALLERHGAPTALITTAGFRDVLAIGRQNRAQLYALVPTKEPPLVPTELRHEIAERVTNTGQVLLAPDAAEIDRVIAAVLDQHVESIAICLLFSFLNPDHEQLLRDALRASPAASKDLHITLSADLLPEYREFERTATTVINAYVAPLMNRYLNRLAQGLATLPEAPRSLSVMQSNGGIIGVSLAGEQAARTVLSGPAGGVVGAWFVAAENGAANANVITFDMGGTSTDVALCPGRIPMTNESEIAGLPLRLPLIDIHTVGAGGGSIVYVDAGGALQVGPESAGARPGPACYHNDYATWRGQMDQHFAPGLATVTDANLVLGRLRADHFLGGNTRLNLDASRQALGAVAEQIGAATAEQAAEDVLRVVNATMERAIRRISVERGHDPGFFTLVAFGGGGPLHACDLATRLRVPRVLVPPTPGVLSALGMMIAAPSRDYSQTLMQRITEDDRLPTGWLRERFQPLVKQAVADLTADGHDASLIRAEYLLDMRYAGQSHELTVRWDPQTNVSSAVDAFHRAHEQRYSYRQNSAAVELVTIRLSASVPAGRRLPAAMQASGLGTSPAAESAVVWFNGVATTTSIVARQSLSESQWRSGPLVVTQYDTTTLVPPGWQALTDSAGNLILTAI